MSTEPTWRVYLPEWTTVWISDAYGPAGLAECQAHFREKYRGRVRDEDWRVMLAVLAGEPAQFPYCVQLFAPNLRGEFKDEADARGLSGQLQEAWGFSPHVVRRDSPEEQALLDYGRKMLSAAEVAGGKGQ